MKKLMIAMAMVLGFQGQVLAWGFSSGITEKQIEEAMMKASAMCRRDAVYKNGDIQNVANEIMATIPPDIKADKNKRNDYMLFVANVYIGCMLTHIKK